MAADQTRWKDYFVFPSMYDGYQKGLGAKFDARLKQALREAGLTLEKMPPAIPLADHLRYLTVMGKTLWPDVPEQEQQRLLGYHGIIGWKDGLLGSAVTSMLRLVGPQRTLTRLDRAFGTTNNFNKAKTEFLGPKEALVTINEVHDMPSSWVGVFEAGLELLGLQGTVTTASQEPPAATFRITWS